MIEVLFPQTAPEPRSARVVRLMGFDEPVSSEARLRAAKRYYAKHKERLDAANRARYRK